MTRQALFSAIVFVSLSFLSPNSGFSQSSTQLPAVADHSQPQWTETTVTNVKPEMRLEFEKYLRQQVAVHKKATTRWFLTFETFAGDTTEYTTLTPVMKFGDLDNASAGPKSLGATEWDRMSQNMARCYTTQTRQYATPHTELEITNDNGSVGSYWVETTLLVAPGKLGEYLTWLANDYRPALLKAGVARFRVSQPIFGTQSGEIVTTRMLNKLADIDEGAVLSKALSEEEARAITAKSVSLVSSSRTRILRMRVDLSFTLNR